jgi:hypothetical protein
VGAGNTDPAVANTINAAGQIAGRFKANANVNELVFTEDMDTTGG